MNSPVNAKCYICLKDIDNKSFLQTGGLYFCSEECYQKWETNQILVGGVVNETNKQE